MIELLQPSLSIVAVAAWPALTKRSSVQRLLRKATIIRATSPAQEGEPFLKDLRTEEDERQEQLIQTAWQGMREQEGEGMGAVAARRQGGRELDWSVHVLSSYNNGDELNFWPRPRSDASAILVQKAHNNEDMHACSRL